jgi:hypothetical protein
MTALNLLSSDDCWTVGAPFMGISNSKVYWELQILEAKGDVIAGYAGSNFRCNPKLMGYVGQDELSWGICSNSGKRHFRLVVSGPVRHDMILLPFNLSIIQF